VGWLAGTSTAPDPRHPQRTLRVCADPNNLPFSNSRGEGFENRIAELLAADLHLGLEYTWWAQRRGFVRRTLNAKTCDVIMGLPADMDIAATTRPYYRSAYVFVSRSDRNLRLRSLDDARLKSLRVGVQLVGDDGANTPPAHALAQRGLVDNVRGFPVVRDFREANPLRNIVDAVGRGEVDVAVVWGPLAGYFAQRGAVPLRISPVEVTSDEHWPMAFDIAVAVRKDEPLFRDRLNDALDRNRQAIERILDTYGVPRLTGRLAP